MLLSNVPTVVNTNLTISSDGQSQSNVCPYGHAVFFTKVIVMFGVLKVRGKKDTPIHE
jgi:hypothetical protein